MLQPIVSAMLIGLIGTSVLHISKGMMRHGVSKLQDARIAETGRRRAWTFYVVAIILNHTNPIWIIWANLYAPPSYYTSMFGLGLIALLAYSRLILHEPLTGRQRLGAALIVVGTVALGTVGRGQQVPDIFRMDRRLALVAMAAVLALVLVMLVIRLRREARTRGGTDRTKPTASVGLEVLFGVSAGLLSSFDPLLKGMGQAGSGGSSIVPTSPMGWALFLSSFLVALCAFLTTNWGFFRGARASVIAASFNATFVTAPVLIQRLALPDYRIGWIGVIGLALANLGIMAIRLPRREPTQEAAT